MTKEEAQAIMGSAYKPGMENRKPVPDVVIINRRPPLTAEQKEEQKKAFLSQTVEEYRRKWGLDPLPEGEPPKPPDAPTVSGE